MVRTIAIRKQADVYELALVEDGRLVEWIVDRPVARQRAGSIYKGTIVNVLPGMQAAFVDIGQGKNAFLYVDDLLPAHLEKQPSVKPSIEDLVRVGEEKLVQISKEPAGTKGARVTTHFSIPGRLLVYMPEADYVGVSRKLVSDDERSRLKQLAEEIRMPGEGLIVRTLAEGAEEEELCRDLNDMRRTWSRIQEEARTAAAPAELYQDLDILERAVRDLFSDEVSKVWVSDRDTGARLAQYARKWMPECVDKIEVYEQGSSLFAGLSLEQEIEQARSRKVWLDSGGYIVFDQTEALAVIDVNTGKYTGVRDLEETVFRTNLEAAEEIGRQIRLRDMGGIIIIDFIDMNDDRHRDEVMQALQRVLQKDRTKSVVVGWTQLGLLEMTRKKIR